MFKHFLSSAILLTSTLLLPSQSWADSLFSRPQTLCNSLKRMDLPTRGWQHDSMASGYWTCFSNVVRFGEKDAEGEQNNAQLYVASPRGDSSSAHYVRLRVTVVNPADKDSAMLALSQGSEAIFREGQVAMPKQLRQAIQSATPGTWPMPSGKARLELTYTYPGNHEVYEVKLYAENYDGWD